MAFTWFGIVSLYFFEMLVFAVASPLKSFLAVLMVKFALNLNASCADGNIDPYMFAIMLYFIIPEDE